MAEAETKGRGALARGWEQAPGGYWWCVGALVALMSAAMLLHESASWALDYASWMGTSLNMRALSCDAHSLGLVFGFAVTQINGARFARWTASRSFWIGFFLVQFANVMAFYWVMEDAGAAIAIVVVQFVGAASGALFFVACSQVCFGVGAPLFMVTIVAILGGSTLVVHGLFSTLEATAPLFVSEILHLGLVVVAAACFARTLRPGDCFFSAYEGEFVPIRARGARGRAATGADAEAAGDGVRVAVPLYVRLFVIVGAYGAVFGFLHVIPLALPLGVFSRVASFLAGAVLALMLFAVTLRAGCGVDVSLTWNRFYRFVFPVVCVAALLIPLTNGTEFLPALIMQACALYYFDALLAMACYVIARAIHAAPFLVFGRAFLIRAIGFLAGNLVGSFTYANVPLDTAAFCVIGTTVFVLLCLVTFNMNSERYAKTVWGLLPREDPRGRYERELDERCDALAACAALTEREAEVLRLLARGKRPKEISDVLVVSVATVRSHVHAIYTKSDVHSYDELLRVLGEQE